MLITCTVEICIQQFQQLGRVEEMVFTARHSYAGAVLVLGVVILPVCPSIHLSVCYTRAL